MEALAPHLNFLVFSRNKLFKHLHYLLNDRYLILSLQNALKLFALQDIKLYKFQQSFFLSV